MQALLRRAEACTLPLPLHQQTDSIARAAATAQNDAIDSASVLRKGFKHE